MPSVNFDSRHSLAIRSRSKAPPRTRQSLLASERGRSHDDCRIPRTHVGKTRTRYLALRKVQEFPNQCRSAYRAVVEVEHGEFDVLVVGAGLSGLAAARRLLAEDVGRLLVVEARDEPGGKCIWRRVGGHLVHPGPAWTAATQDHVKALAAAYGIATYRIDVERAKFAHPGRGRWSSQMGRHHG